MLKWSLMTLLFAVVILGFVGESQARDFGGSGEKVITTRHGGGGGHRGGGSWHRGGSRGGGHRGGW